MTRVIDNLLQNAAKFTAAGSVTLSCEKDDSKRRLRIRVADTGIGIDPDKREWVFERFAKVDPFKPGSGIGLYLCRLPGGFFVSDGAADCNPELISYLCILNPERNVQFLDL